MAEFAHVLFILREAGKTASDINEITTLAGHLGGEKGITMIQSIDPFRANILRELIEVAEGKITDVSEVRKRFLKAAQSLDNLDSYDSCKPTKEALDALLTLAEFVFLYGFPEEESRDSE